MAMEAKAAFLAEAEKRLAETVTAAQLATALSALAEVMDGYDINQAAGRETEADDLMDCYTAALRVEGRSPKTIDRYVWVIRHVLEATGTTTRKATVYHLRAFFDKELKRGVSERTLEGYREVLSAYYGWLQREGLVARNPVGNLGRIKCPKKTVEIFTDVEMEQLKGAAATDRDRALIAFLGATGCRVGELTELDRDAVDLERMRCVVHGKGNKERRVFFDDITAHLLRIYMDRRTDDCEALFAGQRGRLSPYGVRAMIRKTAERAGVPKAHPHKFRRTRATKLSRRGMPIEEIAGILGHENLDTTMKYVKLDSETMERSYRRFA